MLIKKYILNIFFIVLLLVSCRSEPEKIILPLEYSDEKIRATEILEIERILELEPIRAMEKAVHLFDACPEDEKVKEIFSKCEDKLLTMYKESIENKSVSEDEDLLVDHFKSWRLYDSLKTCGSKKIKELDVTDELLYERAIEKLIGDNVSFVNKSENTKISDYINGTVTIWVDLGVKVENGLGYADRVIGSGFFIDKRGYLVTNHHVIEKVVDKSYKGFSKVYIKMADDPDSRIPAKVIGWDPTLDLALLKTEVVPPYVFNLGSSDGIDIGEKIYAIGSPIGLEKTMTSGIVSAFDRKIFSVASIMQIDAAVNTGNSGGPIIDNNGNVQAIAFAGMLNYEGLNFAIPVEYLKLILPYLYNGGEIVHSWCGALGKTKKNNPSDEKGIGVEVFYTMTSGGGFYANLEKGDLIVGVAGHKIESIEQMQNVLLFYLPDTIIPFEVIKKDGTKKILKLRLEERPKEPFAEFFQKDLLYKAMYPIFGLELEGISDLRKQFRIVSVIPGSIADESGFSENDPIEILNAKIIPEQGLIYSEIYAKKRKNGYLDVAIALASPLDSPFIF